MVYENAVKYHVTDSNYNNEVWRARHHYKELHQHDAPFRRSRDFKPVGYGTFRGMPNYKHSEPWAVMKNAKDIIREDHHHPIKWIKRFLFGAMVGAITGYAWFILKPIQGFAAKKLLNGIGDRPWSGRGYR